MTKTYSDYQNEISPDELYKGLLVHGLFSDRLPPIFTMDSFWQYVQALSSPFRETNHDFIYFESMRNVGLPRPFGIPVPMAYERLCFCLKENWNVIQKHFEEQTKGHSYKVSRIHIRKIKNTECLFEMNYKNYLGDSNPAEDIMIGKKYVVHSDISTFFPSVYTHSISWALIGKDAAKIEKDKRKWFNRLDRLCGMTKSGETHGILIGPHTSNLISELILAVVDGRLYNAGFRFIRNIDDYECYVDSLDDGQSFITLLNKELREFDLPINAKKTKIIPLPVVSASWVNTINNTVLLRSNNGIDRSDIKAIMDTVITLINDAEDAAVLKYAVKLLSEKELKEPAKDYYVKTVMHLAIIYPYILHVIDDFVFEKYSVSADRIRDFANIAFNDGLRLRNYEEIYYSIFYALKYNFEIEKIDADDVIKDNDCLYKLFSFLYFRKQKNENALKKLRDNAKELKTLRAGNMDRYWLFCYEALNVPALNDEWSKMKKAKVSFIKNGF